MSFIVSCIIKGMKESKIRIESIQTRTHQMEKQIKIFGFLSQWNFAGTILSLKVELQQLWHGQLPWSRDTTPFLHCTTPTPPENSILHQHRDSSLIWPTGLVFFNSLQVYLRIFLAFIFLSDRIGPPGQFTVRCSCFCSRQTKLEPLASLLDSLCQLVYLYPRTLCN